MKRLILFTLVTLCCSLLLFPSTLAHVPYLEKTDFTVAQPFEVHHSITQSKAVYAWLDTDFVHPCTDVDVYKFSIRRPLKIHLEVIVPVCNGFYANFTPWFALVGPSLPTPNMTLPFDLPPGDGAIIMQEFPGQPRHQFYEPFGGKYYYQGPVFDKKVNTTGTYYVYYWDHYQKGGDYVAVLGYTEVFYPLDIVLSIINVPIIRHNGELHLPQNFSMT